MTATSEIRNALVSIVTLIHEASDTSNQRIGRGVTEDSIADARADVDRIKAALDRIDGGTTPVDLGALLVRLGRARRDLNVAQAACDAFGRTHDRSIGPVWERLTATRVTARNALNDAWTGLMAAGDAAYLAECERQNVRDQQQSAAEPIPVTERSAS